MKYCHNPLAVGLVLSALLLADALMGDRVVYADTVAGGGVEGPQVIFDSDYGPDVDDLVAHAVLHALADLGEAEIIAGIVSISNAKSPGAMNAVDVWHGRPDIPVGGFAGAVAGGRFNGGPLFPNGGQGESDGDAWAVAIYDAHDQYPRLIDQDSYEDALSVYRRALRDADDGSVVIITVGMLNTLSELLQSPGDEIDARTGADLLSDKVKAVYVMGGRNSGAEFNMRHAPVAASHVAASLPVPIYWSQFEIGVNIFTGKWATGDGPDPDHIVRFGMEAYNHVPGSDGHGRQSWDAMNVLVAIRGAGAGFSFERGVMTIDADSGASSWNADAQGPHFRVSKTQQDAHYEKLLEPLVFTPRSEPAALSRPMPPASIQAD